MKIKCALLFCSSIFIKFLFDIGPLALLQNAQTHTHTQTILCIINWKYCIVSKQFRLPDFINNPYSCVLPSFQLCRRLSLTLSLFLCIPLHTHSCNKKCTLVFGAMAFLYAVCSVHSLSLSLGHCLIVIIMTMIVINRITTNVFVFVCPCPNNNCH